MNIEVPFLFLVSLHFHCNLTKCRLGEYDMIFHKIFIKIKYKLNTGSGSATTHHSPPPPHTHTHTHKILGAPLAYNEI